MRARTLTVMVALVSVVAVTGAAAFTTATVARDAQIDVATDANGVIGIEAGNAPGATTQGSELVLNADNEDLNLDATFTYGDDTGPGAASPGDAADAFRVTNNDDRSHEFTFNLTTTGTGSLTLYLQQGTDSVQTLTSGGSTTITVPQDETVYVAAEVETGTTTGEDEVDGTFTITVA
jgi:hypothetical protein